MTDLSLVKNELREMMKLEYDEVNRYEPVIRSSAEYICSLLCDEEECNSACVVHLCATRSYCQILLLNQSDDVTSFKAGDVSFTRASSALDNARALYESAKEECAGLLRGVDKDFSFRVV